MVDSPNRSSGTWVVVLIAIAACIATGISIWHHRQQTRNSMEYWGSDNARLIRYAPEVRLYRLEGNQAEEWETLDSMNVSKTPGLIHFRQALIEDASFSGNVVPGEPVEWSLAIQFREARGPQTIVLIDTTFSYVKSLQNDAILDAQPIGNGLKTFLEPLLQE